MIAQVIIDISTLSLDRPFDYKVKFPLDQEIQIGSIVLVPFNRKDEIGVVVGLGSKKREGIELLEIKEIISQDRAFDEKMLELCQSISKRYLAPLTDTIRLALPPGQRVAVRAKLKVNLDFNLEELTERELKAAELLKAGPTRDGMITQKLLKEIDSKMISTLKKKGFLKEIRRIEKRNGPVKTVEFAYQNVSADRIREDLKRSLKSAKKQSEILKVILNEKRLPAVDLIKKTGASRASLNSLCKKGLIRLEREEVPLILDHFFPEEFRGDFDLNLDQDAALKSIEQALDEGEHKTKLLYGVTASGKTEIYLRAAERALRLGKSVLILVPEISLTPQIAHRFNQRFEGNLAILHSALSPAERFNQWEMIKTGRLKVVLGARSAIFAPLNDLGLIILDEEHESAYKQNVSPRYHALFAAKRRAEIEGAILILGSATPSLETRFAAESGRYELLKLPKRVMDSPNPVIEIVDMKGEDAPLSGSLKEAIKAALRDERKVILFLNRRGYFGYIICKDCGYVYKCAHCDVSMVYHLKTKRLECHHCGFSSRPKGGCPSCQGSRIGFYSMGTERVEVELRKLFPNSAIIRMDKDTTKAKGAHRESLIAFKESKSAILIGTQMIAKGLDFPDVGLVGVINSDTSLHLPDFRSEERTFQLLMQISGRAGRGDFLSRVIIQTHSPASSAILAAQRNDYDSFYESEIIARKELKFPPFSELINIVFTSKREESATLAAKMVYDWLGGKRQEGTDFEVLGPTPSPISRLSGQHRWHLIIKTAKLESTLSMLREAKLDFEPKGLSADVKMTIDVDPLWML